MLLLGVALAMVPGAQTVMFVAIHATLQVHQSPVSMVLFVHGNVGLFELATVTAGTISRRCDRDASLEGRRHRVDQRPDNWDASFRNAAGGLRDAQVYLAKGGPPNRQQCSLCGGGGRRWR